MSMDNAGSLELSELERTQLQMETPWGEIPGCEPGNSFDFEDELIAAAAAAQIPDDDKIASIAKLADQQRTLESRVARLTDDLKAAQAALDTVSKVQLPNAMELAGVSEFKLTDGSVIKVEPQYYASISQKNEAAAFAWLRAHNHDGIIKTEIKIQYGKGDAEKAAAARAKLEESSIPYSSKESVHASTLKAFVKEQLTKPKPGAAALPEQTFGVFTERVSTIKGATK